MNKEFNANINLLVRSEKALLKMDMRVKSRQVVLVAVALIAVLIALVMINVTAYLFLDTLYTPVVSAAILTAINLFVALVFFVIASKQDVGQQAEAMQEIRDYAWSQISSDIDEVKQNATEFKESIQQVSRGVNSVFRGVSGIKGMMPIVQALFDMENKKKQD